MCVYCAWVSVCVCVCVWVYVYFVCVGECYVGVLRWYVDEQKEGENIDKCTCVQEYERANDIRPASGR